MGAGANPAGAGDASRNAEFDDNCPVPKKEQSTSDYDYRSNSQKKKKQSDEQCKLDEDVKAEKREIVYRIKEDSGLVWAAEEACKNRDVQKEVNHLEE